MTNVAIEPHEIEARKRERTYRLAVLELPTLRAIGCLLLSLAIYLHNEYVLGITSFRPWLIYSISLAIYCAITWTLLAFFYRRDPPRDLTLYVLIVDVAVWTGGIYISGGEASWLFFILLLRVADQTQTNLRRCVGFALYGLGCYAAMLAYIALFDNRPIAAGPAATKLTFLLFAGLYIALAARTAESRRAQMAGAIRMSRDLIRRLEQQSAELDEARAHAEEASAAKSEFLANMSHEMRTPLQGVIGMLQLVLEDANDFDDRHTRQLDTARRSAEALLATIDDILDFSKIEARRIELEPIYFSLRQAIGETMKSLGVAAAAKGLTLSYLVQNDVADTVWGDPLRLRQVVVNLVGNSIKFTAQGEIAVRVTRRGELLRFEVRDTGIGIEPALRQKIFEPFTQADSSHSRRYGGTGLGLAIVARLIDAMRGSVEVQGHPGGGSTFVFTVTMPSDAVGAAMPRQPWEAWLAGRSILIVEPAPLARSFIAEMLRARGVFATACATAAEAPRGRYACAITSDPAVDVEPKVMLVTPLTHHDYPIYVMRPLAERELFDMIGVALGFVAATPLLSPVAPAEPEQRLRVLLVEDNVVNQEFVFESLHRLGHSVVVSGDGAAALEQLASESFDLVFMDVQLPGMDGLDVTRAFRAQDGRTPVVGLTAHSGRAERTRCFDAGMNEVLTKPVDVKQLAATIRAVLGVSREILDAVGGNPAVLARVSDAFSKQTPELIAAMREACARSDGEALYQAAHKLKGSVSHFPGDRALGLTRELEAAARAADFPRAVELMPRVEAAVEDLGRRIAASV
ncbi:MAG TPA: ATP-binding protein [Thermoanaerobaculia bacterium]|nr:ATP-binding protein [Thermoanaerobaculia bacterium]